MIDIQMPPPEYRDVTASRPIVELALSPQQVQALCHWMGGRADAGKRIMGCALLRGEACIIVIPAVGYNVTAEDRGAVREHEEAHCKGWGPAHEGAR